MSVDLSEDFFSLFALPKQFSVDIAKLTSAYRELQQQLHPDRFVGKSDAERRWSMQAASMVNEGYQTLKHDLPRASYMLRLEGIDLDDETDTQVDPMFLMEQMELREALEAAESSDTPFDALTSLRGQLRNASNSQREAFSGAVEVADYARARTTARQWQFLDKLQKEVKRAEERLDA